MISAKQPPRQRVPGVFAEQPGRQADSSHIAPELFEWRYTAVGLRAFLGSKLHLIFALHV